jgi:hypothetical protein
MYSRLLAGMIAVMSIGGMSGIKEGRHENYSGDKTARIIVEVNQPLENLSKSEIISTQDNVVKAIKRNVTRNFDLVQRYSVLNNAFVLDVNKEAVEAIRALPEVASVTYDKIHAKKEIAGEDRYSVTIKRGLSSEEDTGELEKNISSETMHKPSDSNEGEGTVIAILDNEFYLRGETKEEAAWNHVVYKALPEGVAQKFTFDNLTEVLKSTNAKRLESKTAGQEGSLYFNTKVPFYFDYGGESTDYGKVGPTDYDVSSTLSYHGSHVASIASANADTYKGIAPNAQLACMKVFTTYEASETGEQMGFGTSTGAYDSAILSALEDAITLGVDGINMSLGSDLDDFDGDSITMKTLANLKTESGIMSAISAGNAGKSSYSFTGGYGNWTTDMVETGILGSYANSAESTIIAAGQPTEIYYENAIRTGGKNIAFEDQIVNREGMDADYPEDDQHWLKELIDIYGETIQWQYVPGFGAASDYSDVTVKGKVAVVNRGSLSFAEKYNIAVSNGAIGVIIINNDPTANDFNFRCSFGDDFSPTVPCALVLYKDKVVFESQRSGTFTFIFKDVSVNDLARTISTFSSDGARWDYDLKPDITAPGENIRGAVPPQKKEDKELTPLSTYEYLSGTSMSAPNYAGAQSLVLSKVAKEAYADGELSDEEKESVDAFRRSVDMRLMSTADPMLDAKANPEKEESEAPNYTSPRLQGAGMVNLEKAYNTDVYLEGLSLTGEEIGKSKICLYNSEEIANGTLKLKFVAHNEGSEKTYKAKLTVMRPAIATNNKVIPDMYTNKGEVDSVEKIPGITYYEKQFSPAQGKEIIVKKVNDATASLNDVIKLTKQIVYYTTEADREAEINGVVLNPGYYKNTASSGCKWEELEGFGYQSVQDAVIAEVEFDNIVVPAGKNTIELPEWSLTTEQKADILSKFEYGCAIEGYVELLEGEERKLSIPYLGFYSGKDVDGKELKDAPVVEPFSFEKDPSKVYPSDLVNDVTRQLLGKDNAEFGSTWTVGYSEEPNYVNVDQVLTNDTSFEAMYGWHKAGSDPATGKYYENPQDHIYVGNPEKSNTMIIQQYVMRSVKDNFFEIKNEKGEVVYKSILEDMLFGDGGQLYKSHVDSNYLSAGYVGHRAYAVIPLYDLASRKAFADGKYTITFNYQLQCDDSWSSKSYSFILDSTPPAVKSIKEYTENGEKRLRIEIEESKVAYASLGLYVADVKYDATNKLYYIDESLETIESTMNMLGTLSNGQKRLTLSVTDAAYGTTSAIIHFFGSTYSNYVIAQGSGLANNQDFIKDGSNIAWFTLIYGGGEIEFAQEGYVTIYTHIEVEADALHDHVDNNHDGHCDICGADMSTDEPDEEEELSFFEKIGRWFSNLFKAIGDFFRNLFSGNK